MKRVLLFVGFVLALLLAGPAWAETPCSHLSGVALERYNQLGDEAISFYREKDYARATELILELREICDEDPIIVYNLARTYERAGNCNTSRYWYEELLETKEGVFEVDFQSQREKATAALVRLEEVCSNSTRVEVRCADEGVALSFAGLEALTCPHEARVDAGQTNLKASKADFETYEARMDLVAGERNLVLVPTLSPVVPEETEGRLQVACDESEEVRLSGNGEEPRSLQCPITLNLRAGAYRLEIPAAEIVREVEVRAGEQHLEVIVPRTHIRDLPLEDDPLLKTMGWSALGAGVGLVAVGFGLHLWADDQRQEVLDAERSPEGVVTGMSQVDADEQLARANMLEGAAYATLGLGALGVLGGAALLIVADLDAEPSVPMVQVAPDGQAASLVWRQRW